MGIPISERFRIPVIYWLTLLSLLVLLALIPWNPRSGCEKKLLERRFTRQFLTGLLLFTGLCIFSLAINHLGDRYVPDRSVTAEALSLGQIVLAMALVAVIPMTTLSKSHARACIQAMIALAVATSLLMGVFSLMPGRVTGYLGWTTYAGGTLDLARGRTPLGHPNTVAALLQLFMAVAAVLGVRKTGFLHRLLYLGAAAVTFFGILFTLSRGALAATGVTLLLIFGYLVVSRKRSRAVELFLMAGFIAAVVCTIAYLFSIYDFSRFWSTGYYETAAIGGRTAAMRTSALVWRDHLLLGTGPGALYPRLDTEPGRVFEGFSDEGFLLSYRGRLSPPHPHSVYLMMLAEFGLLGTPVMVFLVGSVGWMLYSLRKRLGNDPAAAEMVTAAGMGLVAVLLSGVTETLFLLSMRCGVVMWTFFGLAIRYGVASMHEEAQLDDSAL